MATQTSMMFSEWALIGCKLFPLNQSESGIFDMHDIFRQDFARAMGLELIGKYKNTNVYLLSCFCADIEQEN